MHSVEHTSDRSLGRKAARLIVGPAALSVAVFGGSAALASPAFAATPTVPGPGYGANGCTITINITVVGDDGVTVTVSGNCGNQGDKLVFTFNSTPVVLGSTTAGTNGAYSLPLTLPSETPLGQHTITVSDSATGDSASAALSVVEEGGSNGNGGAAGNGGAGGNGGNAGGSNGSSGGIAFTGADTLAATAVGAGAIGVGGILLLSSRKRRRNSFTV